MQDRQFYDIYDLSKKIGLESDELLDMIRRGLLPMPCVSRKRLKLWSKEDLEGMTYLLKIIAAGRIALPQEKQTLVIDPKKNPNDRFVYFIQESLAGAIKIGSSASPKNRLLDLQTSSPYRLSMLGVVIGGIKLEKKLHRQFKHHRLNGEWFSKEILTNVMDIIASHGAKTEDGLR